jgi:hypothetical protein
VVTLQNLNGPGKGCPVVSTTFQAQAAAISAGTPPSPQSAASPASTVAPPLPSLGAPTASDTPAVAQIEALAPPLGFNAGINPTGK